MKPRIVKRYWTQFMIAFGEGYTLDGFKRTEKNLELPQNLFQFEARLKRELTICNLFANQNQSIAGIARVLDMNYGQVVNTLIDHGFIRERRRTVKKIKIQREMTKPKLQALGSVPATLALNRLTHPPTATHLRNTIPRVSGGLKWWAVDRLSWQPRFTSLDLSGRGVSS
jgi:hypothetical protein